jgi:hypothetical protein
MKRRRPRKFFKIHVGATKKKLLQSNSDDRKKDTDALSNRGSPPPKTK